ncbi:MAG: glycosyltransferase family 9 protein [Nitrospirae bacterium]|nr:glycosyltransferase family 9 protein [Nitrospirota bacterium]
MNSYNADVISGNPDLNDVYVYEKAKHAVGKSKFSVWLDNLKVFCRIRKERYDVAIACGSYSPTLAKYAFMTGARLKIGYANKDAPGLFLNNPVSPLSGTAHEVMSVFNLLGPLGIHDGPGKLILVPDGQELRKFQEYRINTLKDSGKPVIAIAISARLRANKWPVEKFMALIDQILSQNSAYVLLLWAPGSESNLTFPGDDESAERICSHFGGRIAAYPTHSLKALIAAIAGSDIVVTLDTGSLHMAAAMGKVTIALMTKGKSLTWYPWKTESIVLTADNNVEDIQVNDVLGAVNKYIGSCREK